jgi:hypothetical protein
MTMRFLRRGLAAVLAAGGVATVAAAQQPQANPQVIRWPGGYMVMNGTEVVVRHAGTGTSSTTLKGVANGFGNKVTVSNGPGGGTTVITNSRAGVGNTIVVDDRVFGTPRLDEQRRPAAPAAQKPLPPEPKPLPPAAEKPTPEKPAEVEKPVEKPAAEKPAEKPPEQPAVAPPPAPVLKAAPTLYKGKGNTFWSKKEWSEANDCNVYWDPATKAWYRYHKDDDTYRPLAESK